MSITKILEAQEVALVAGTFVLAIQSTDEDSQERALFWLGGPRKAKRCDICYGVALTSVFASGRVSFVGAIQPHRPRNDDIHNTDMERPLLHMMTIRHPGTLFALTDLVALCFIFEIEENIRIIRL